MSEGIVFNQVFIILNYNLFLHNQILRKKKNEKYYVIVKLSVLFHLSKYRCLPLVTTLMA